MVSSNKQKAIVLTGCSGGIGTAITQKLTKEGIAVIGVDKEASTQVKHMLAYDLLSLVNDSEKRQEFEQALIKILEAYDLCGLINNAAYQVTSSFKELTLDDFRQSIDINLTAPFVLSQFLLDRLTLTKGTIINISSIHTHQSKSGFCAYACSKAGLSQLTRSMAIECGKNIKVVGIEPGAIATEMLKDGFKDCPDKLLELESYHPVGAIGKPDDLANLCYWLISEAPVFINGSIISVDGGISHKLNDPA